MNSLWRNCSTRARPTRAWCVRAVWRPAHTGHPRSRPPTHCRTLRDDHAGDPGGDGGAVCRDFVQNHQKSSRRLVARGVPRFLVRSQAVTLHSTHLTRVAMLLQESYSVNLKRTPHVSTLCDCAQHLALDECLSFSPCAPAPATHCPVTVTAVCTMHNHSIWPPHRRARRRTPQSSHLTIPPPMFSDALCAHKHGPGHVGSLL
jgi:hypothetical protein